MSIEFQAFWEAVIGVLLLVGAAVLIASNQYKEVTRNLHLCRRADAPEPTVPVSGRHCHP